MNTDQIKLVQIAVKAAGIRLGPADERYYLLLRNYKQPNGSPVTSCKQLNNSQLEDILAICESQGWRMPGKPQDFFRRKVAASSDFASYAQQEGIKLLAGDLGWNEFQLGGMLKRMTGRACCISDLKPGEAYKVIEALKAMLERKTGETYKNLNEIESRLSDKQAEDGTFALSGLRGDVKDDKNQGR